MTPKQQRFVEEYLIDLCATQAAIRAGYSQRTAYSQGQRLLKNVEVHSAIAARTEERSERTQINADMVLHGILHNIRRCEQGEVVRNARGEPMTVETPDGDLAVAYRYDASNALKGYELLGRHLKLFTDRREHERKGEEVRRVRRITEDMDPVEAARVYRELLSEPSAIESH